MSDEARLAELAALEREAMVPSAATRAANLEGLRAAIASGRAPIVEAPPPPTPAPTPAAWTGSGSGLLIGAGLVLAATVVAVVVTFGGAGDDDSDARRVDEAATQSSRAEPVDAEPETTTRPPPPVDGAAADDAAPPTVIANDAAAAATPDADVAADTDAGSEPEAKPASTTGDGKRRSRARSDDAGTARSDDANGAFAEELRALKKAKRLADAGRPGAALGVLNRAHTKYGKGFFSEERLALRVQCLCAAGRDPAARAAAKKFFAEFPASPQTERVRNACD